MWWLRNGERSCRIGKHAIVPQMVSSSALTNERHAITSSEQLASSIVMARSDIS